MNKVFLENKAHKELNAIGLFSAETEVVFCCAETKPKMFSHQGLFLFGIKK